MWNRQSWMHIYLPIILGGLIYTLFRVDTLLIFKVYKLFQIDSIIHQIRAISVNLDIPSFVKYSLPDGLWVYAFTYFLVSMWRFDEDSGKVKYLIMGIPLLLGGGAEILQLFIHQMGTFDVQDLLISLLAFAAAYIAAKPLKARIEGEIEYG
ncbi:hypothetical protein [Ureibacillus chungkukjangi]|uniref:VanZ like protein n=1 Tax=Ureibacillus chungkukjangi TaxID=1202712 RepID=A0A318TL87_9BACL|nr:hypothetical protein [Ureibacillus chungkukjangi]PYF05612.1 hypothetical protein BJ095_11721 [Ureibacillus chungkukjangi]